MDSLKAWALLSLIILLSACGGSFEVSEFNSTRAYGSASSNQRDPSSLPPSGQWPTKWPSFDWDQTQAKSSPWNFYVYEALETYGTHLLAEAPLDIQKFCPNYLQLEEEQKKFFWISLVAAMSRFESGFDPEVQFQESFTDAAGNHVVSRGLLQLSIESANGYKCGIEEATELHDPHKNLECTVRILDRWLKSDKVITGNASGRWLGGARYWSVLRKASTLSKIMATTSQSEICR